MLYTLATSDDPITFRENRPVLERAERRRDQKNERAVHFRLDEKKTTVCTQRER